MKEHRPSISVVIPTYNRSAYILDAIHSVIGQGEFAREILVVDDGSTDDTLERLRTITDPRLKVLQQANRGPAAARNLGWRTASSEWIAFLDSDDALSDDALKTLVTAAGKNPGRIPFGQASVHGQRVDTEPVYTFSFAYRSGNLLRELCFYSAGTILSSLIPKRYLEEIGGFSDSPETHFCEDLDLAIRLALRYEFAYVPQVTYRIRMHDANRHRPDHVKVWESSVACVERHLSAHGRHWLLKQQTKAYYNGLVANHELDRGEYRSARRQYLQCLRWWPVKLGAWKGLLRTCK